MSAGSKASGAEDVRVSNSTAVTNYTVTWDALTVGGGKYATGSVGLKLGRKDISPVFATPMDHPYELHIQEAKDITVLFYSSSDRRGWLLDGASALVYLAHARLASVMAGNKKQEILGQLRSIQSSGDTAEEVLQANRHLIIFEDSEFKDEEIATAVPSTSADSGYASGHGGGPNIRKEEKAITTRWTYQKLVLELWQNLAAMKASLDKLRKSPPNLDLRRPGLILTGWEAKDVIRRRQMQEPRYVRMCDESRRWIKYAQAMSSVVLMARDFGEMIIPDDNVPVCLNMQRLPKGRDLLAVPLHVLHQTAEQFLLDSNQSPRQYIQIASSTYLYTYDALTEACRCSDGQ